jgi:hypothetical protein
MDSKDLAAEEQRINSNAEAASEDNTPTESPTVEQTTEEVEEPEIEVATEEEGTETETAESNKGAAHRIKELNQRAKAAEERAKSLADRLAEITEPIGSQEQYVPQYNPQVSEGETITPERYQADVARVADARVELKIKQNDAVNRINQESNDVIRKYSQLNPDSDDFDKELSETVTEATEAMVRQNPYSASVSKFVDRLMKPYQGSVAKEVGKVTENIAKQVSETALRPTSIRKQEKPASEKSIAELEQELGIVQA